VSTSGFYQRRAQPVTDTELAEAWAANTVRDIWLCAMKCGGG
jgi:hypothetical protein